jgi:O-antigen/teichoic acid export membrane protein
MADTEPMTVSAPQGTQTLVLRNALFLVVAQAASMPISILVNAVMARYLGAQQFGYFYLASTLTAFGFLLVDWGQNGTLPAMVARDRGRAGEFLGSGLAWRALASPVVYALLALAGRALNYPGPVQVALALMAVNAAIGSALTGCQDTVRGFERTDIAAYSMVGQQVLTAVLILPVLALGGGLSAVLVALSAVAALVLLFVSRVLRPVGVGRLRVRWQTTRDLLVAGWPFLLFGVTMALQPNIDAIFLSKLAPAEVVGWHAAARRLLGALVFPASALVGALYPTLCRLYGEDDEGFRRTCREALRTSLLLVAPLALGTFLYADEAIRIFSKQAFGPAADNLRLLAPFVLLVYVSMPLGSSLMAAGRQRTWAVVQMLCVLVSLVLDPLLVPWFQQRTGNGGLGVCIATVVSEALMVGSALWLMPRGVFNRALVGSLLPTLAGASAMAVLARLIRDVTPWVAGPVSVLGYFAALWALGGLGEQQLTTLKAAIAKKTRRS